MTGMKHVVRLAIGLAIGLAAGAGGIATAAQQRPYRLNDQQLRDLVSRIDTHRDAFRDSYQRAVDRSPINGSAAENEIDRSVESFKQATELLRKRVNDRQSGTADANDVLQRASVIDDLVRRYPLDTRAQSDWHALQLDMTDLARAYGIQRSWGGASQTMPSRIDDKQVEQLLKQIGNRADGLQRSLDRSFDRSRGDDRQGEDEINRSLSDFRQAVDRLRDRVKDRQSKTLDVEEVLRRGVTIDSFMHRYQLSAEAEQGWLSVRRDLDTLAHAYNVAWNWSNPGYASEARGADFHHRLTGTYQLEANQGDDPRRAADTAVRGVPSDQRQRMYQRLLVRLESPDLIAIERNENRVTMASTHGGRVTFEADGVDHVERWSADRTMNTRATLLGERLVVATTGNRDSDYTVTFDPLQDGRRLHVTRTIDDEGLRQPVTVQSVYRRLSDDARWNIEGAGRTGQNDRSSSEGDFGVPDGTRLVAVLDHTLNLSDAREGDRYTMTARSPSQYEGAVIEGFVSTVDESALRAGSGGITLNLRSIRLHDGRTYQFDGVVENIRTPDGDTVSMDPEGTLGAGDSQAQKAIERGAIGAALGAIIGAVAGGGKGAAIGAVIGAGGGAGTVIFSHRDRKSLQRGTEFTIVSGGPWSRRAITRAQP